jgi:hypothetical protein
VCVCACVCVWLVDRLTRVELEFVEAHVAAVGHVVGVVVLKEACVPVLDMDGPAHLVLAARKGAGERPVCCELSTAGWGAGGEGRGERGDGGRRGEVHGPLGAASLQHGKICTRQLRTPFHQRASHVYRDHRGFCLHPSQGNPVPVMKFECTPARRKIEGEGGKRRDAGSQRSEARPAPAMHEVMVGSRHASKAPMALRGSVRPSIGGGLLMRSRRSRRVRSPGTMARMTAPMMTGSSIFVAVPISTLVALAAAGGPLNWRRLRRWMEEGRRGARR